MGYDATNAGIAVSPAGLVTMIEVPIVGWLLSRGTDARRMIALGIVTITVGTYWLSLGNLNVAERDLVWPRVVQILGLGLTTVPLSTIMFRFLPADQSSNAAGIYALVRNEGGSIGIALSSTFLQRRTQVHQTYLAANLTASNGAVRGAMHAVGGAQGFTLADRGYASMATLYGQLHRQATLMAYMDQYRMFAYLLLAMLPLVLLLKRPPKLVGKIELEAH